MSLISLEQEIPLEAFIMAYPDYLGNPLDYFRFRPFFKDVSGVGVEIGTFEGYNALGILKYTPTTKLYCVDPYKAYKCSVGEYMGRFDQNDWDEICERTQKKLEGWDVEFVRKTSQEASQILPNDLDWVYIDGNHSVEACYQDLCLWGKKVKVGGKFGGHDASESEIQIALSKWVQTYNIDRNLVKFEGNEWMISRT